MIAVYCIGGLLALIVLLLSSPVSVRFYYRDTPELVLRVWGFPIRLLPVSQQKQSAGISAPTAAKSEPTQKDKPAFLAELQASFKEDGVGAILHWMGELASLLTRTVGRLLRAVAVKNLRLEMRISGEDAAAAATNYGKVCAVFYPLFGALCAGMRFKKHDITLRPDFADEGTAVLADVTVGVSLWRLAGAAIMAALGVLGIYLKMDQDTVETERTVKDHG